MRTLAHIAIATVLSLWAIDASFANDEGSSVHVEPESAFGIFLTVTNNLTLGDESLDGDYFVSPPDPDYGYHTTPKNALTFLAMGVDGVHTAILTIDNVVSDESPVVRVYPLDEAIVLAPSFLDYLALGCATTPEEINRRLHEAHEDPGVLLDFLKNRFKVARMFGDAHLARMQERYEHRIDRKSDCELFTDNPQPFVLDMSEEEYAELVKIACAGE